MVLLFGDRLEIHQPCRREEPASTHCRCGWASARRSGLSKSLQAVCQPARPLPATLRAPEGTKGIRFDDLLRRRGALYEVVVTFLAVLELSKYQRLRSRQSEALSEIWLLAPDPDAPRVHPDGTPIDPEPELLRPVGEPVATA